MADDILPASPQPPPLQPPTFQASTEPVLDWMPWNDQQQQQGSELGSILGQLKSKMTKPKDAPYSGGGMYNAGEGFGDQMVSPTKANGGKGSL